MGDAVGVQSAEFSPVSTMTVAGVEPILAICVKDEGETGAVFILHPSSFILHPSSFILHWWAQPTRRWPHHNKKTSGSHEENRRSVRDSSI